MNSQDAALVDTLLAIDASFVFWRKISRKAFWNFCNKIGCRDRWCRKLEVRKILRRRGRSEDVGRLHNMTVKPRLHLHEEKQPPAKAIGGCFESSLTLGRIRPRRQSRSRIRPDTNSKLPLNLYRIRMRNNTRRAARDEYLRWPPA